MRIESGGFPFPAAGGDEVDILVCCCWCLIWGLRFEDDDEDKDEREKRVRDRTLNFIRLGLWVRRV